MDAYIGEIRLLPFTFAPQSWLACDGSTQPVQRYQALAAVLGNTYGPMNQNTFVLPDLRGLVAVGTGQGPGLHPYQLGKKIGSTDVALSQSSVPPHDHTLRAYVPGTSAPTYTGTPSPTTRLTQYRVNNQGMQFFYKLPTPNQQFSPLTVTTAGGNATHNNQQPFLALQYCICWDGIFPMPAD